MKKVSLDGFTSYCSSHLSGAKFVIRSEDQGEQSHFMQTGFYCVFDRISTSEFSRMITLSNDVAEFSIYCVKQIIIQKQTGRSQTSTSVRIQIVCEAFFDPKREVTYTITAVLPDTVKK